MVNELFRGPYRKKRRAWGETERRKEGKKEILYDTLIQVVMMFELKHQSHHMINKNKLFNIFKPRDLTLQQNRDRKGTSLIELF